MLINYSQMLGAAIDFLNLFYPINCGSCGRPLIRGENHVCTSCQFSFPRTNHALFRGNEMENKLMSRMPLGFGAALFEFKRGGKVQRAMNNIKYRNRPQLAEYFGELAGTELKSLIRLFAVDNVVPVPLHPKKQLSRGYNQADHFGSGLALRSGISVFSCLSRKTNTETQTRKNKIERWLNVSSAFKIKDGYKVKGKHLLIVDDVLTTGSTIEACSNELLKEGAAKISVATIAIAKK